MKVLPHLLIIAGLATHAALTQATEYRYFYTISTTTGNGWTKEEPLYDAWKTVGEIYGCSNWSPSTSSIGKGISFVQQANDCKQEQVRVVHPQRKNNKTGIVESIPNADYTESRIVSASLTRDEIGVLENWFEIDPTYTAWMEQNALYSCSSWSPAPSSVTESRTFTQTATDCRTDQFRYRQNREQERTTLDIRNTGAPIAENQTLTDQIATRSYSVTFSPWTDSAEKYGCSNWSPDTETVAVGEEFEQSATDCSLDQSRSRHESYIDHRSAQLIAIERMDEIQTLKSQMATRTATGTAAAPTAWLSAPTATFINTPITLTWSGTNVKSYALRSDATGSGFSTSNQVVNGSSATAIPTTPGQYTYELTATNAIGVSTVTSRTVIAEGTPSIGGLTTNGVSGAISVSPSTPLTFAATDLSSGAAIQGRNSANSAVSTLPSQSSTLAGTTTYYATATKTINGVTNVGNLKSVDVTVIDNPVIGTISASTTPLTGQSFTLNWSGTGVTSYTITGSSNSSGIPTTGVNLGAATTKALTPTVAGTYTYTITAQNSLGVKATASTTLIVNDPSTPSVHGLVPLTGPSGGNTALKMPNGVNYTGTISQMKQGVATELSLLIGNYSRNANGVMTLNVCSTSGGCATGTANVVGSVDNANIPFQFNREIVINNGDTLTYTVTLSGSTYGPAIWMYPINTLGNASYLSGTSKYPYIVLRYL